MQDKNTKSQRKIALRNLLTRARDFELTEIHDGVQPAPAVDCDPGDEIDVASDQEQAETEARLWSIAGRAVRRSMAHLSACAWANTDCAKNAATRYRSSGLRSSRSHRLASIVSTSANARSRNDPAPIGRLSTTRFTLQSRTLWKPYRPNVSGGDAGRGANPIFVRSLANQAHRDSN